MSDSSSEQSRSLGSTFRVHLRAITRRVAAEYRSHARYALRWLLLVLPASLAIGSVVAFFLVSLDVVTEFRWTHPWLLMLLPLAGIAVGLVYHYLGRSAEGGNNLIVDEIHQPGAGVPGRMAPLILFGTLATHLFGGSAGREGTAVQIGGSIASALERLFARSERFALDDADKRVLLQSGIAAGFGAVFGTPITGAVFALEVLAIGQLSYGALVPCLIASVIGDWTTHVWGVSHTAYPKLSLQTIGIDAIDPMTLVKVTLAAAAFGLASTLFAELTHGLGRVFRRLVRIPWLRPALGGLIVIGLTLLFRTDDYLGLGVRSPHENGVSILASFRDGNVPPWGWALKTLFTSVTLSSGFKGGEVTPLFFVGATLGHTLAELLRAPIPLFAAAGFVGVFAGATNTPLACTIMGIELFGAETGVYLAAACFLSYLFSGHSGIYLAQRLGVSKGDLPQVVTAVASTTPTLRELHAVDLESNRSNDSRTE